MPQAEQRIFVGGAPEGLDALLIARLHADTGGTVLHIARDDRRMSATREALRFFAPAVTVAEFPAWDCPPYSRISPNPEIMSARMATLTRLAQADETAPGIVLTTVNAAMQRVPARDFIANSAMTVMVGDWLEMGALTAFLGQAGYSRSAKAVVSGEFAVRGGIVDVFPAGSFRPVRLDFFGDRLDGARTFDPETQMTVGRISEVKICRDTEISLEKSAVERFRRLYRAEFGAPHRDDRLYTAVSNGLAVSGLEHWLPFFHENLETIFDYLPNAAICIDDRAEQLCEQRLETLQEQYSSRKAALRQRQHATSAHPPLSPELLYLDQQELSEKLQHRAVRQFFAHRRPTGYGSVDAGGRTGRDFSAERQKPELPLIDSVAEHLKELRRTRPVFVACWSEGSRSRFSSMFDDVGLRSLTAETFKTIGKDRGAIDLAVLNLERGFVTPEFAVVSEQDVFGERLVRKAPAKRTAADLLAEASEFSPGDLVVHKENGVGRYLGLETVAADNALHDCAVLEYADDAKLYLPIVNIDLLSKFGSSEAPLDRLGAANWQERKARLKKRLLDMADELIRTAAQRSLNKAPVLIPENPGWNSFQARFQYRETDDQEAAINDVVKDLAAGIPMDRLICGDVGFGKTEVAMRAAFIAAMGGVQVALVAPTTLLVRQHFDTFRNRFAGFPVNVRQLSRTVTARDEADTKAALADGTCDIVIGTHALFAKSVKFKQLGLLLVDEEQSFGVAQKEYLKSLRSAAHVLALTATPIPRTMQMALSGVRDLTIIGTPPIDRLAIRTYVLEFDAVTVRTALLHELYRGGQSFIVAPRVRDLPDLEKFLDEHVPEVSYATAHGQLPKTEIENRTAAFYDGNRDVLLSTTIIASGLDIPTANTIIIVRADRFGLAQLYQIRGRVGRSGARAYAYITFAPRQRLTDAAAQRLETLGSLDALGAGFTLAAKDLDLRGSGNLLGEAQKGHIREVGVELYQKMLEEAVAEIRSGGEKAKIEPDSWAPQLNLRVSARIPESFVSDLSVRLGLYRRIGILSEPKEIEGFAAELVDRFGPLPSAVETLLEVVRIKRLCQKAGISRLDAGPRGAAVEFLNNTFNNPGGLMRLIAKQHGTAKVRGHKLVFRREWAAQKDRLKGVRLIAAEIAKIAA